MPEVIAITEKTNLQIRVTRILIDESVRNLKATGESFMSDITTKQAYQCRKRMMKHFNGEDVTIRSYPASVEDPDNNSRKDVKGYLFRLFRNS